MSAASRAREQARRIRLAVSGKPRNPTARDRARGEPRLSEAEWVLLREWQAKELAKYTDTPEAQTRREQQEEEMRQGEPLTFPPIPEDSPPMDTIVFP